MAIWDSLLTGSKRNSTSKKCIELPRQSEAKILQDLENFQGWEHFSTSSRAGGAQSQQYGAVIVVGENP